MPSDSNLAELGADTDQSTILFKSLDDLVQNRDYSLSHYPLLEPPRQRCLDPEDGSDFKWIPRDYCVVSSPGHISWQYQKAQDNSTLEIFYTDAVRIPRISLVGKFQDQEYSERHYLNRWELQDFTRARVENTFSTHLGLTIPLKGESSGKHWVPAVCRYNVEVEQDVWQDRMAVFFDGFVETSMQSMQHRLHDYKQKLSKKGLGRLYLAAWKSRWKTEVLGNIDNGNKSLSTVHGTLSTENSGSSHQKSLVLKERGRKRRAAIRQMRIVGTKPNANITSLNKTISLQNSEETLSVSKSTRGRLRRRERRKGRKKIQNSMSDEAKTGEIQRPNLGIPQNLSAGPPIPSGSNLRPVFSFRSGELVNTEELTNKVPVSLTILLRPDEASKSGISSSSKHLPTLLIQPLDHSSPTTYLPKRYHIISYCNESSLSTHAAKVDPLDGSLPNINFHPPGQEKESKPKLGVKVKDIHVADLVDEVGIFGSSVWASKSFFSVLHVPAPSLKVGEKQPPGEDYNTYWHKFLALTYGFRDPEDICKLPYSLGYGIEHSYPPLVTRNNRWGYFDVDSASIREGRPRWRANWKFEMNIGGDKCQCSLNEVSRAKHDLNSCRYLRREDPSRPAASLNYHGNRLPDEILSDTLSFAHSPQELLQELDNILHKFYPRYKEKPKTPENLDGSSLGDATEDVPEEDEIDRKDREKKYTERMFEHGIAKAMGLGVPKDIKKGMSIISDAAGRGCSRAQAIVSSLARCYDVELPLDLEILGQWLKEQSLDGSKIALEETKKRFPVMHMELVKTLQLRLSYPKPSRSDLGDRPSRRQTHFEISYPEDILPYFDFSNLTLLSEQLSRFNEKYKNKRDINVMLPEPRSDSPSGKPDNYFVFGSLLHLASAFGFYEAAEFLINEGFDVNAQSLFEEMITPLFCALGNGHANIAKLLIEKGASCEPLYTWIWMSKEVFGNDPVAVSPLHYLVYVEDEEKATELARMMVKNGADVNFKCSIKHKSAFPASRSMTALRYAVMERKPQLVRVLLGLGAKFAYEKYLRDPKKDGNEIQADRKEGCLLLEAPCTDINILEMFFARARVPGIPIEFSQTPLGLLVSEDDGPERRLRPGFESFNLVRDALDFLLELQPGYEDVLLWSVVRHDHAEILRYLIEDLGWSVETRWMGLTALHTAVLYGRVATARYLLTQGADATAVTEKRGLTALHLLCLVPRHPEVDHEIFDLIEGGGRIEVDAREKVDGLTPFHLAVRNRKTGTIKRLLKVHVDTDIFVKDQLPILSWGKTGLLALAADRPSVFTEQLTILGEVIIQYIQHNFYGLDYVSDLLLLLLDSKSQPLGKEALIVDKGNGISLLHLLAMVPDREVEPWPKKHDPYSRAVPKAPAKYGPKISLLQMVLVRTRLDVLNIVDTAGDTALHFACAGHQTQHISSLLSLGANPGTTNIFGLRPVDVLAYSILLLGGNSWGIDEPRKSWHPRVDFSPGLVSNKREWKELQAPRPNLAEAFTIFEKLGFKIDEGLERLALAWDYGKSTRGRWSSYWDGPRRTHLEIVGEESFQVKGNHDPDKMRWTNWTTGQKRGYKRPYLLVTVKGPEWQHRGIYDPNWGLNARMDFERESV